MTSRHPADHSPQRAAINQLIVAVRSVMHPTNEIAVRLGVKPDEIEWTADSPAGLTIKTRGTDTLLVVVPDDHPDAEGKTGVMLAAMPSERGANVIDGHTCWNRFPVYVGPGDPGDAGATPDQPVPVAVDDDGLDALDKDQLVALCEQRGIDIDKRWGVAKLRGLLRGEEA